MRRALAILLLGCTTPTNRPQYETTPLPPLTFDVQPEPPRDSAGQIVRDALFRVSLDDYPDPDTAGFGPLLLRSGTATFDATYRVDLVGRSIEVRPRSLLMPETVYEVVVGTDLRALSGRTVGLTVPSPFPFSVGHDLNPSPSPSPSPLTWDTDIRPIMSDKCVSYCHTPDRCPGRDGKHNPSRNLDLSPGVAPDDPVYGVINVPAVSLAGTDKPLLRVQRGDAARSVFLRKMLGGDPHADSSDPPTDDLAVPGRRMPLYESVCGEPLPPKDDLGGFYLDEASIRTVQEWITQGAAP
jgi:hypothetical protein